MCLRLNSVSVAWEQNGDGLVLVVMILVVGLVGVRSVLVLIEPQLGLLYLYRNLTAFVSNHHLI